MDDGAKGAREGVNKERRPACANSNICPGAGVFVALLDFRGATGRRLHL